MFLWIVFIICTGVIFYSGTKLAKYGDIIAEKTGLGRTWMGIVIMASVTSLPELATGIGATTYANVPNIAVGDILGSCVFNLLILALLDIVHREEPIKTRAHHGHMLAAGFFILLMAMVGVWISAGKPVLTIGWVGLYSLLIIIIYSVAIKTVYSYEKRELTRFIDGMAQELKYEGFSKKQAFTYYFINAIAVIAAAASLPKIGEILAVSTGLGQTFVGNIFIAVSTSLPEVVVSLAAVKMGAIELAIGNLLGSNLFNILILAIDDFFFIKGPILYYVDAHHINSALTAIAMTSLVCIGITYRSEKKPLLLPWDSIGMLLLFVANLLLLYMFR